MFALHLLLNPRERPISAEVKKTRFNGFQILRWFIRGLGSPLRFPRPNASNFTGDHISVNSEMQKWLVGIIFSSISDFLPAIPLKTKNELLSETGPCNVQSICWVGAARSKRKWSCPGHMCGYRWETCASVNYLQLWYCLGYPIIDFPLWDHLEHDVRVQTISRRICSLTMNLEKEKQSLDKSSRRNQRSLTIFFEWIYSTASINWRNFSLAFASLRRFSRISRSRREGKTARWSTSPWHQGKAVYST